MIVFSIQFDDRITWICWRSLWHIQLTWACGICGVGIIKMCTLIFHIEVMERTRSLAHQWINAIKRISLSRYCLRWILLRDHIQFYVTLANLKGQKTCHTALERSAHISSSSLFNQFKKKKETISLTLTTTKLIIFDIDLLCAMVNWSQSNVFA